MHIDLSTMPDVNDPRIPTSTSSNRYKGNSTSPGSGNGSKDDNCKYPKNGSYLITMMTLSG